MRINMTHDVVVPVAVAAVTVALRAWDSKRATQTPGAKPYGPALNIAGLVGGFAMQKMGWMPEVGNSIALCCAVPAMVGIYDWASGSFLKGISGGMRSPVARRVAGTQALVNPLTQYDKSGL